MDGSAAEHAELCFCCMCYSTLHLPFPALMLQWSTRVMIAALQTFSFRELLTQQQSTYMCQTVHMQCAYVCYISVLLLSCTVIFFGVLGDCMLQDMDSPMHDQRASTVLHLKYASIHCHANDHSKSGCILRVL
jgi:hypothetical protein